MCVIHNKFAIWCFSKSAQSTHNTQKFPFKRHLCQRLFHSIYGKLSYRVLCSACAKNEALSRSRDICWGNSQTACMKFPARREKQWTELLYCRLLVPISATHTRAFVSAQRNRIENETRRAKKNGDDKLIYIEMITKCLSMRFDARAARIPKSWREKERQQKCWILHWQNFENVYNFCLFVASHTCTSPVK